MKKTLVLFIGIAVLYAAYVFFYRPNLLINGNFSRSLAGWQFAKKGDAKQVAPEDEGGMTYLALVPGGEICQFFLSGLAAGDVCEARPAHLPARQPYVRLYSRHEHRLADRTISLPDLRLRRQTFLQTGSGRLFARRCGRGLLAPRFPVSQVQAYPAGGAARDEPGHKRRLC